MFLPTVFPGRLRFGFGAVLPCVGTSACGDAGGVMSVVRGGSAGTAGAAGCTASIAVLMSCCKASWSASVSVGAWWRAIHASTIAITWSSALTMSDAFHLALLPEGDDESGHVRRYSSDIFCSGLGIDSSGTTVLEHLPHVQERSAIERAEGSHDVLRDVVDAVDHLHVSAAALTAAAYREVTDRKLRD